MFICRHLLLRAYVSRRLLSPVATRRLLSGFSHIPELPPQNASIAARTPTQTPMAGSRDPSDEEAKGYEQRDEDSAQYPEGSGPAAVGRVRLMDGGPSQTTMHTEVVFGDAEQDIPKIYPKARAKQQLLEKYYASRNTDSAPVASQNVKEFCGLIRVARNWDFRHVARMLANDVLAAAPVLEPSLLASFVESLLLALVKHRKLLPKRHVFTLLQALEARGGLLFITERRIPVIKAVMSLPPEPEYDARLREMMTSLLLDTLVNLKQETSREKRKMSYQAIWPLFRVAYGLAKMGDRERARDIIQRLVTTENVSMGAIASTDLASGDFDYILVSIAVRSCMLWGWRDRATWFIANSLPREEKISPKMAELTLDTLWFLLDPPLSTDIVPATGLIQQLMQHGPAGCVPHDLLQEFYRATRKLNRPELAQSVYTEARDKAVQKKHVYPPPRNELQLWFMQHLASKSMNVHLAREFATQLAEEEIPVHLHDRGSMIALIAKQGLARPARILWERYSEGPDSELVRGNATSMVRMVSLFTSLAKRKEMLPPPPETEALSDDSAVDGAELSHSEAIPDADLLSHGNDVALQPPFPRVDRPLKSPSVTSELKESTVPEIADAVAATVGAPMDAAVSAALTETTRIRNPVPRVTLSWEELEPAQEEPAEGETSNKHTDSSAEELRAFAERVLSAFRGSRPLKIVKHVDLNAMARACFMLGKLSDGFVAFRMMLMRHEVPDIHDVNVVLAVLSEYSPQSGASIIERMLRTGMQPDGVTFGTVIHHAVVHGDMDLVSRLIRRARQLHLEHLTFKTVGTLIRGMVSVREEDGMSTIQRLGYAQRLVEMLTRVGFMPSSNMGRDCVLAALRADDPQKAFQFWKLVVKGQVQWDDLLQAKTRRLIMACVRRHMKAGWLSPELGRVMLLELEEMEGCNRSTMLVAEGAPGKKRRR